MALITLTSDFGTQDFLAGAIKGILLRHDPACQIVDITHDIHPFNYPQAAYICRNAFRHFPAGSYHLVLVNLFEKKPDQLLLAYHKEQYLLCADNGLLTMILEEKPEMLIGLPVDNTAARNTLQCVAIFGNAIRAIENGHPLPQIGRPDPDYIEKIPFRPLVKEEYIEGQIIYIDNFENVVVNITREQFEAHRRGRAFNIVFKRNEVIDRISETYADVPEGEKLALFNSAGYLEIAVNKGNAAGLFGLQGYLEPSQNAYMQNRLFYQTVKIFFQ
ncbi:MAG: SAM-dependent chlorinase/fluorinase [Agriterribacter sp.]